MIEGATEAIGAINEDDREMMYVEEKRMNEYAGEMADQVAAALRDRYLSVFLSVREVNLSDGRVTVRANVEYIDAVDGYGNDHIEFLIGHVDECHFSAYDFEEGEVDEVISMIGAFYDNPDQPRLFPEE